MRLLGDFVQGFSKVVRRESQLLKNITNSYCQKSDPNHKQTWVLRKSSWFNIIIVLLLVRFIFHLATKSCTVANSFIDRASITDSWLSKFTFTHYERSTIKLALYLQTLDLIIIQTKMLHSKNLPYACEVEEQGIWWCHLLKPTTSDCGKCESQIFFGGGRKFFLHSQHMLVRESFQSGFLNV